MTKTMIVLGLVILAVAPGAQAQSANASYCTALVQKYEQYLDMGSKRGRQPQSLESRAAADKCRAGDASGIPGLEKALLDAKIDLPPKT
ncbi:MAG: hypothetical protein LCH95_09395 [Proteobacteria bacterium]|nr:hypothetical protein [Pseudomonadota bacterium]